ncbi:MAG: SpoIIE family protein phosphatase [Spirochaetes bacterium]|jgi:serine phosphatase RsbU (regulator of sigma subunit)|nr:SpoIIE family protein phosphatase [Spirochaetota bacterium]
MKLPRCLVVYAVLAVSFFSSLAAHASQLIVLYRDRGVYHIGRSIDVYEDATGRMGIEDMAGAKSDEYFKPCRDMVPNFGYTGSAVWFRIKVMNDTGERREWILELAYSLVDSIRLYWRQGAGFAEKSSGREFPFDSKDFKYRQFAMKMSPPPGVEQTYYLRVASRDSLPVPLKIWDGDAFTEKIHTEQYMLGLYYGLIGIMILFNIFLFITIRDRNYVFYVLTLLSMHTLFMMGLNGISFEYIGRNSIWWSRTSIAFFFCTGAVCAGLFCLSFLELRKNMPVLYKIILGLMTPLAAIAAASFFIDYHYAIQIGVISGMAAAPLYWLAGMLSVRRGYRPARFYVVAWTMLIFCGMIYGLKVWGFLPSNFFTEYSWQIGCAVETLAMSVALGDRINLLRRDQMEAQQELLEKERQAREAQEKFNESLERLVEERTNELNGALEELKQKDHTIQRELDIASDIQQSILPPTPLRYNGICITAHYRSMEKIGGDFYDIFPMKGGHLCIVMADVSGHGIPAAFVTAMAKITFSEATQQLQFPKDILRQVNDQMIKIVKTKEYLTAFVVIISPSYEVFYSNASHQKAYLLRKKTGELEVWDTNGLFVGAVVEANTLYEEKQDFLDFGDRLFLYTDGIVEARNTLGEEFGHKRLLDAIMETSAMEIDGARAGIIGRWESFVGEAPVRDDMSLMILEIDPAYRELLEYKNRGLEHLYHNRVEEAIGELKKALNIDGRDAKLHHLIGKCYFSKRDYPSAISHLKIYIESNGDDADSLGMIAASFFNIKDYAAAMEYATEAGNLRPDYKNALTILGLSLKKLNRKDESISVWERLLAIDPENSVASAEILLLKGEAPSKEKD